MAQIKEILHYGFLQIYLAEYSSVAIANLHLLIELKSHQMSTPHWLHQQLTHIFEY